MKFHTRTGFTIVSLLLVLCSFLLNSCKDEVSLPQIGGYDNADQIGASNLMAHWDFEDNLKESVSGILPDFQNNLTFVPGIKGKCIALNSGIVQYNSIPALSSLPSFTVSAWVKLANNGTSSTMVFSLTRPDAWEGAVNMMVETNLSPATNDTLNLKCLIDTKVGTAVSTQENHNDPSKGGDQVFKSPNAWFQIVNVYDASKSKLYVYANGIKIDDPALESRIFNTIPLGALSFFTPTQVVIGAFSYNVPSWGKTPETWMKAMTGQLDEIRVWNSALTPETISSLYKLELAGR